jgi:hypothetical protein
MAWERYFELRGPFGRGRSISTDWFHCENAPVESLERTWDGKPSPEYTEEVIAEVVKILRYSGLSCCVDTYRRYTVRVWGPASRKHRAVLKKLTALLGPPTDRANDRVQCDC